MRFSRAFIVAIAVTIPAVAFAEPGGGVRGACMNDIKTLCAGVQPGGGRIRDCIKQHRQDLSQACKTALVERMMARRQGGSAGRNFGAPNGGPEKDSD